MVLAQNVLWYSSALLSSGILLRLYRQGLLAKRPYGSFAMMLATMLLRDLALMAIPVRTLTYTVAWEATLPLVLLAHVWSATGTYRSIAALYPKIGNFALRLFAICLAAAFLSCFAGLPFETAHLVPGQAILRSVMLLYRWVDGIAAGALMLAVLFFQCFPSPLRTLPRNLIRHTALLFCYFGVYSLAYFAQNLVPLDAPALETGRMFLVTALYATWIFSLSAAGEFSEPWARTDSLALAAACR
jgi:hypothetical protein